MLCRRGRHRGASIVPRLLQQPELRALPGLSARAAASINWGTCLWVDLEACQLSKPAGALACTFSSAGTGRYTHLGKAVVAGALALGHDCNICAIIAQVQEALNVDLVLLEALQAEHMVSQRKVPPNFPSAKQPLSLQRLY